MGYSMRVHVVNKAVFMAGLDVKALR